MDTFFVTRQRLKRFVINIKIELGGKTDTPHHAKWVIAEGDVRVKWCTDCTLFQIIHSAEWVYQFAETFFVEAYRHCIDGEITSVLVVFQCSVFHYRLAAVVAIRLFSGTDKLHFRVFELHLCCSEILENRDMRTTSQFFAESLSYFYATAHHYYIYIFRRAI